MSATEDCGRLGDAVDEFSCRIETDLPENETSPSVRDGVNSGDIKVVEQLLESDAQQDSQNVDGLSPIHRAALNGSMTAITELLRRGAISYLRDISGRMPVHLAAQNGHTDIVSKLVECDTDNLNPQDNYGRSPMHYGAQNGQIEVITKLIEFGADLHLRDNDGRSPLHYAALKGQKEVVTKLIICGADLDPRDNDGCSPIHYAALNGYIEVIVQLIECGANLQALDNDRWSPMHYAAGNGQTEVVSKLIESKVDIHLQNAFGRLPIHYAAQNGQAEVVTKLIKCGSNVSLRDNRGRSPIHYAAQNGHIQIVTKLIESGDNLDIQDCLLQCAPIHFAALYGQSEVVTLLVERGANLDLKESNGRSPMHYAADNGHAKIVTRLLKCGACLDPLDNDGCLPMHYAAQIGHSEVVTKLIDCGTNLDHQDHSGRSPIHYAALNGRTEVFNKLLECGANLDLRDDYGCPPKHYAILLGFSDVLAMMTAESPPTVISRIPDDDRALSTQLHESLMKAGFNSSNAAVQVGIVTVLEAILNRRHRCRCYLVSSFADGWGSCFSGISGKIDVDSDIDITMVESRVKLHLAGSQVEHDKNQLGTCEMVEYKDGHVSYKIGISNPCISSSGMMLRPSVDRVMAYACCNNPEFTVFSPSYKSHIPGEILTNLALRAECHVVAAAPPKLNGQRMRVSTTLLERELMRSLTTLQGQLFILLKYIVKRTISRRVRGLKTYHAKNLLFFMLDKTPCENWRQPQNLIQLLRRSLKLLLDSLDDPDSSEHQCMRHFFMRDAAVYLRRDHEPKKKISATILEVMAKLPQLLLQFEDGLMKEPSHAIEFHPFRMLSTIDDLPLALESNRALEYHEIYDAVRHALLMLSKQVSASDEASHLQLLNRLIQRIPDWARTARETLKTLTQLRESKVEAWASIYKGEGLRSPEKGPCNGVPCFSGAELSSLQNRSQQVWEHLKSTDSAWKFMFNFDQRPELEFLPGHMRRAFPWQVPNRSDHSVYMNFHSLRKSLQLEAKEARWTHRDFS